MEKHKTLEVTVGISRIKQFAVRWIVPLLLLSLALVACQPIAPEGTESTVPETPATVAADVSDEGTPEPREEAQGEATEVATEAVTTTTSGEDAKVTALASQMLAEQLQISPSDVEVISTEAVEWPDACMGVYSADTMCVQIITPGYLVILSADGVEYEVHTNQDGSYMQLAKAPELYAAQSLGLAFTWHREGGFAGFCDDLSGYITGELVASTCKGEKAGNEVQSSMTADELEQLNQWIVQYEAFQVHHDDGAVADSMLVHLNFFGTGDTVADAAAQQEILAFVEELYAGIGK